MTFTIKKGCKTRNTDFYIVYKMVGMYTTLASLMRPEFWSSYQFAKDYPNMQGVNEEIPKKKKKNRANGFA